MNWVRTKLKHIASVPISNGVGEPGVFVNPEWPRYVRTTDIAGPRALRDDVFASLPPEVASRARLERGDIVMTAAGATVGKSLLYDSDDPACYAGYLARFRPRSDVDPRFVSYWTESKAYWDQVASGKVVSTIDNFSAGKYQNLWIDIPRLQAQHLIADYLDAEMARIDALIEAELRRFELASARVASATQALVLGRHDLHQIVNDERGPLVPVPDGWTLRRNKTFMTEVVALSDSGMEELLTVSHITGVTPRAEKDVAMFLAESNEGYKLVQTGNLVINTMWAWMGALGVSPVPGIVSPAYGVYRFTESGIDPRYFDALFRSPAYVTEMTRYSKGVWTSRLRLYPDEFLALRSPFPPLEEQTRIGDAIEQIRSQQARPMRLLERGIELLAERRQALITAAVTGQIAIPGVAA